MKIEETTLNNGLRIIFVDTKAFPTLTTLLLVGAGSRYENKNNNGVAHFFEHMAFKGSKKYPNSLAISSTIEGKGGVFNAFTSKDHTGYWIKSTVEHFETAIDVISDMIQNPLLSPEEIEREKGVIVEEINMYEDMPQRRVRDLFEELLYKGNPLGYDIAGSKKNIRSFTRRTFTDYIKNLYQPKNTVLVVAGGLSDGFNTVRYRDFSSTLPLKGSSPKSLTQNQMPTFFSLIKEKFSGWRNGERAQFKPVKEEQTEPQIYVKHKKTEQAHFCLGWRAFGFSDKRKYVLKVLAAILGGGMSSSLFIQVRERRGLCYYISTSIEQYADCGNIVTQAGVVNNQDKIKKAIEVILKEHKKISQGDIKKDELKRAKQLIKGRFLLSLEDSTTVASFFGTKKLLQNKIETAEEVIDKIERVTADEVIQLAKEIFTPKTLNLALIGPFTKEDFVKSLKF